MHWWLISSLIYGFLGLAFYAVDVDESNIEFRFFEALISTIFWLPIMVLSIFHGEPKK